ncbi:hypothetical protein [Acinetobacter sp. HY1485]|uniref:hypothetical protein n=1 Tax=Acinetobacter sp. HY1485 TaxID=2970918 RepID=UPI0022B97EEF|nr:hypothetical protein [Acinetobacter sp. HY1485]
MWFLLIVLGIGLIIYFLNKNKTEKRDITTITHKRTIQTEDGEVSIERRQTFDTTQTSYKPDQSIDQKLENLKTISVEKQDKEFALDQQPQQEELVFTPSQTTSKECPKCNKQLTFSLFGKSPKNSDGLTKWCLDCLNNANKKPQPKSNQKYCPHCKRNRMKTSFGKNSKQEDGLTKWCRDCMKL